MAEPADTTAVIDALFDEHEPSVTEDGFDGYPTAPTRGLSGEQAVRLST